MKESGEVKEKGIEELISVRSLLFVFVIQNLDFFLAIG